MAECCQIFSRAQCRGACAIHGRAESQSNIGFNDFSPTESGDQHNIRQLRSSSHLALIFNRAVTEVVQWRRFSFLGREVKTLVVQAVSKGFPDSRTSVPPLPMMSVVGSQIAFYRPTFVCIVVFSVPRIQRWFCAAIVADIFQSIVVFFISIFRVAVSSSFGFGF
jgi:hypothetical protein